jgi:hypothetical protein
MKFLKQTVFMAACLIVSGAPAAETNLNEQTVYSAAGITMGANSTVYGNLQTVAAATLGADAQVGGNLVSGAAVTLGANGKVGGNLSARDAGTIGADATIGGDLTTGDAATLGATTGDKTMVGGNLTAGAAILVGVKSKIGGDLKSGAAASADLGASASVGGSAKVGTALTLGADATVGVGENGGNAQAATGAVALGERAEVVGNARAGTIVTVPASANVKGEQIENRPESFSNAPKGAVDNKNEDVAKKQQKLRDTDAPNTTELAASQAVSIDLESGIYHATSLTTTAGISLTFKGIPNFVEHWLINVDTFIDFGANLTMVLEDVDPGSTITFNAAGYTAIGASSKVLGTFYAGTYITTGASVTLNGIPKKDPSATTEIDTCGGLFTASGAITLGASNTIGSRGCTQGTGFDNGETVVDETNAAAEQAEANQHGCADAQAAYDQAELDAMLAEKAAHLAHLSAAQAAELAAYLKAKELDAEAQAKIDDKDAAYWAAEAAEAAVNAAAADVEFSRLDDLLELQFSKRAKCEQARRDAAEADAAAAAEAATAAAAAAEADAAQQAMLDQLDQARRDVVAARLAVIHTHELAEQAAAFSPAANQSADADADAQADAHAADTAAAYAAAVTAHADAVEALQSLY